MKSEDELPSLRSAPQGEALEAVTSSKPHLTRAIEVGGNWNDPLPPALIDIAFPPIPDKTRPINSPHPASTVTRQSWPVWRPLLVVVGLSALIRFCDLDRAISSWHYDSVRAEWPFERAEPWLSFYRYGTIPPVVLGIAGGLIAILGGWFVSTAGLPRMNRLRRSGLFLALLLLIGPGLLVNVGLKTLWGRPRPIQCADFGGEMTFMPVGEWAKESFHNSSFPSGHAAVAFFLMGLGFVISTDQRRWQQACFWGGIGYGLAMGITRIMQGGHFPSDVLWAGALVYFVAVVLARLLLPSEHLLGAERNSVGD